jgi:hypothetical protein
MRALTLTRFGGLDGVVLTDVAEPEMPDDAVTVRVHTVALAKWDVTTTEGVFVAMGGMTTFPQVVLPPSMIAARPAELDYANRSLTMTTTVAGVFPLPRARQALEAVSRERAGKNMSWTSSSDI